MSLSLGCLDFMSLFRFYPERTLNVGLERETYLTRGGKIVPLATQVLDWLWSRYNGSGQARFTYELSGCQLEDRLFRPAVDLADAKLLLLENEAEIVAAEKVLDFQRLFCEVAPTDVPLNHYPAKRYDIIVEKMPRPALTAACRVAGTHIHIGMPDHQTALRIYNKAITHFDELCKLGDHSNGERLKLFQDNLMTPDFSPVKTIKPPYYHSWEDYYNQAVANGFTGDPRRHWAMIRLSKNGTIEFRMFGSTASIDEIMGWTKICLDLCQNAF